MSSVNDLGIYQIGIETTMGTAVATTNRLISRGLIVTPNEPVFEPQAQLGYLLENPTSDSVALRSVDMKLSGDLTFEQILYVLSMAMKGLTSGTGANADKTWAFDPSYTADPALKSFTIQRRLSDGTTNWDEAIAYVMAKDFKVGGQIGQNATFEATLFGRPADTTATLTPTIGVPTVNFIPVSLFKVFIDSTYASLGATQVAASIYSFEFRFRSQAQPKFYVDGRADKSFTAHGLKRAGFDLDLDAEWTAAINAERAKAADRSIRYVRLQALGATLGSSQYEFRIDLACRYQTGLFDKETEREGNDALKLKLIGAFDSTNALAAKVNIVCGLTSLP